jgi:imidazolonepropionase-like amidohydrolase
MSTTGSVETAQLTQAEIEAVIDEAHRLGKRVAAHAYGGQGARIAARAGVDSIEHGAFLDDETLALMQAHGTALVPTCLAIETLAERTADLPAAIAAKARAAREAQAATLSRAVAKGVAIAFGSDSGVMPHGRNAAEFHLLVQRAGLTAAQALRTVAVSAKLLGLAAEIGTLEVGKQADIIAVPGDVLADVRATERVFFVMKGGTIHRHDTPAR